MNTQIQSFYRNMSRMASGLVVAVGLLVLLGWVLDVPALKSIFPGLATMKANTAIAFVMAGISLWQITKETKDQRVDLVVKVCATITMLIGLLTLVEYVFDLDFGIDQFLFKDELSPQNIHPGRMSPATALNLLLLGLSLLILDSHWGRWLYVLSTSAGLIIAGGAVIGYLYNITSLYKIGLYSSIALHTAITTILLGLGILSTRPQNELISTFTNKDLAGILARRLLLGAIVVPILLGQLFLTGQRLGLYDTAIGIALFALSNVIIFSALTWWNARVLSRMEIDRGLAENALLQSEERFTIVFRSSPTPIALTKVDDGKTMDVNDAFCKLFGYAREEAVGHTSLELGIVDADAQQKRVKHVKETGKIRNMEIRARDRYGNPLDLLISVETIQLNDEAYALTTMIDITDRKRAEDALQKAHGELELKIEERTAALSQTNSLLQMLLDHMPDHIYFKDAQSRFIKNSRSQAKALGLNDPAEAVGKSDFDFFTHAQQSFEKEQEIIRSGRPLVDQEERVVWPNGQETWVSTTKAPLRDQAGRIMGTFGISRDITDRKRAEIALQKAKLEMEAANKELEAFSYSVSHDLRAPLRSIDGFSQALLEDYGEMLPLDGRSFLERIRHSAQRMADLIDDLLNLSRVTRAPLKSVAVDLTKLAENIAAELKRSNADRHVQFIIAQDLRAGGDSHLLQIVLENLMNNAWKFTSKREQAEIEVGIKSENGDAIYFVRDNGAGFDMAYVNKLFGAFQRLHAMTEFPGTGIGLATIQRIIHRHGGRVWAEGAVDRGATFFFTLPVLAVTQLSAQTKEEKEEDSIHKRAKEII